MISTVSDKYLKEAYDFVKQDCEITPNTMGRLANRLAVNLATIAGKRGMDLPTSVCDGTELGIDSFMEFFDTGSYKLHNKTVNMLDSLSTTEQDKLMYWASELLRRADFISDYETFLVTRACLAETHCFA